MPRVYLVRHGQAAAGFDQDRDPGLSDLGRSQAQTVGNTLAPKGPHQVISSPLRRCRETSQPLCATWDVTPNIVEAVAEIPSPTDDLSARTAWLQSIMPGRWADIGDPTLETWRDQVVEAIRVLSEDTVVFSHFIAINAIVGHMQNDDRMVVFRPDNGSITTIDVIDRKLSLVEMGAEAETQVR